MSITRIKPGDWKSYQAGKLTLRHTGTVPQPYLEGVASVLRRTGYSEGSSAEAYLVLDSVAGAATVMLVYDKPLSAAEVPAYHDLAHNLSKALDDLPTSLTFLDFAGEVRGQLPFDAAKRPAIYGYHYEPLTRGETSVSYAQTNRSAAEDLLEAFSELDLSVAAYLESGETGPIVTILTAQIEEDEAVDVWRELLPLLHDLLGPDVALRLADPDLRRLRPVN